MKKSKNYVMKDTLQFKDTLLSLSEDIEQAIAHIYSHSRSLEKFSDHKLIESLDVNDEEMKQILSQYSSEGYLRKRLREQLTWRVKEYNYFTTYKYRLFLKALILCLNNNNILCASAIARIALELGAQLYDLTERITMLYKQLSEKVRTSSYSYANDLLPIYKKIIQSLESVLRQTRFDFRKWSLMKALDKEEELSETIMREFDKGEVLLTKGIKAKNILGSLKRMSKNERFKKIWLFYSFLSEITHPNLGSYLPLIETVDMEKKAFYITCDLSDDVIRRNNELISIITIILKVVDQCGELIVNCGDRLYALIKDTYKG